MNKALNKIRQSRLFSLPFTGSGSNGAWTASDWKKYHKNRDLFCEKPNRWDDSPKNWESFAKHAEQLASHYSVDQKDQFVRDFALLFGGISGNGSWTQAALGSAGGPEITPILTEKNKGLASQYLDTLKPHENQSHHYAGIFFLAYFAEPESGVIVNLGRELKNITKGYNAGDVDLGNQAAQNAHVFRYYQNTPPSAIGSYIRNLIP